ncbi:MAG: prepilin peptidase [Lachnospiraceae bacterium]|nr:prepilin peptidase [Lachnospiraceae bacterium]
MLPENAVLHIVIFIFGLCFGSFFNVVTDRLPRHESIVTVKSHCESCGYDLKWYDNIPLLSYIFLKGRCRKCQAKLSIKYPLMEIATGALFVLVFLFHGISIESGIWCLASGVLLTISVIDWRTYEIPIGLNYFLLALGLIHLGLDYKNWFLYVIGAVSVSLLLYIIYLLSKGRAIGGGDIKLMAVMGLLLGWKLCVFGFVVGCVAGSVIHILRMKISKAERMLAMGPYLSAGLFLSMLVGERFMDWYLGMLRL